jgi:hypothetical protein
METFELRRTSDGRTYVFKRAAPHLFCRSDNPAMTIGWEGPWGWLARMPDNGIVAGRPWEILPQHQSETAPPRGVWISRKGAKSYVYDLVPGGDG